MRQTNTRNKNITKQYQTPFFYDHLKGNGQDSRSKDREWLNGF